MPNGLITKSIAFAKKAHRGQYRKDGRPYIVHPASVARLLCIHCENEYLTEEIVAAAWLHDVVEDTNHTHKDILYNFGQSIYRLVFGLTNQFTKEDYPRWTRERRKKYEHERLKACSLQVQLVKAADRICNISDLEGLDESYVEFQRRYIPESQHLCKSLTKITETELGLLLAEVTSISCQIAS